MSPFSRYSLRLHRGKKWMVHGWLVPLSGISILNFLFFRDVSMRTLDWKFYQLQAKDVSLVKVPWWNQKSKKAIWDVEVDMYEV